MPGETDKIAKFIGEPNHAQWKTQSDNHRKPFGTARDYDGDGITERNHECKYLADCDFHAKRQRMPLSKFVFVAELKPSGHDGIIGPPARGWQAIEGDPLAAEMR
jgi:hypothetical protein